MSVPILRRLSQQAEGLPPDLATYTAQTVLRTLCSRSINKFWICIFWSPAIMKRNRNRPTKQNAPRSPKIRDEKPDSSNSALPPNKQINKHADEIYGDTEIPSRRK